MKLLLKRIYRGKNYTIGKLYIDGKLICDTLEDTDRGLKSTDTLKHIQATKVYGRTAIPIGTYKIVMDVVSPKFSRYKQYQFIQGKLPRLLNVPGFEGILVHIGNKHEDTDGCILVGSNIEVGKVLNSTYWFSVVYRYLKEAKGEITITIE